MRASILAAAFVLVACGGDSFQGGGSGGAGGDGSGAAGGGQPGGGGAGGAAVSSSASTGGKGGAELQTCTEQYGTVPGFDLCSETSAECMFNAVIDNDLSCLSVCESRGGECVKAFANPVDQPCLPEGEIACNNNNQFDVLCLCTVGCAGQPACRPGSKCIDGACN